MSGLLAAKEQVSCLARGVDRLFSEGELLTKISSGRPLRVKLGLDPTAPDIHLGHTVVLRKLRQFQDYGHQAVLIIGDATAKIGDPTGKSSTRPILTDQQVQRNLETYLKQVSGILDLDRVEIVRNSVFFNHMCFDDVLRLAGRVTVARMLEREDFQNRYQNGLPISLHEFLYPLMQGWDSVQVRADVELGGTDQTFNILMGRDLQRDSGQSPQVVMVMPILPGLDGIKKMSKSLNNYIGVSDSANEMFGKVMSIPDSLMKIYFTLLTDMDDKEISCWLDSGPREAKGELARSIVAAYHGSNAAKAADIEFTRVFSEKNVPLDIPLFSIPKEELGDGTIWICRLIQLVGHAATTSEAKRLILGGGVTLDGEKIEDFKALIMPCNGQVLKSGKRRYSQIEISA